MNTNIKHMTSRWAIGFGVVVLLVLPVVVAYAQADEASSTPEALPGASEEVTEPTPGSGIEGGVGTTTASSTVPIPPPPPAHPDTRTVFLQPSVKIDSHLQVGTVQADISLRNFTCRDCDATAASVQVKAYLTPWYSNDEEVSMEALSADSPNESREAEQTSTAPSIAPWQEVTIPWEGEVEAAGRYYFVVVVDPTNALGARDIYRTEVFVD